MAAAITWDLFTPSFLKITSNQGNQSWLPVSIIASSISDVPGEPAHFVNSSLNGKSISGLNKFFNSFA